MVFLIGSCWAIVSFVNDVTNDLPLLNVGGASNRNEITKRFCRIVEFYLDVKQLSALFQCKRKASESNRSVWICYRFRFVIEFNAANEFTTTGFFLWALLTISCNLLVFQMQLVEFICKYTENTDLFTWFSFFFPFSCLLQQKQSENSSNEFDFELIITLVTMFWSFGLIFLFCEVGEMVNLTPDGNQNII